MLATDCSLVVLGNDLSGKTTLIARLQGVEEPKKSYGLEYTFLDVKDEARGDQAKLNVWILDGDLSHSHLIKFAVTNTSTSPDKMVAILTLSMAEPWTLLDSLEEWTSLLSKHINRLELPDDCDLMEYRQRVARLFRAYVEPDDALLLTASSTTTNPMTTSSKESTITTSSNPAALAAASAVQGLHPATAALLASTTPNSQQQSMAMTNGSHKTACDEDGSVGDLDPPTSPSGFSSSTGVEGGISLQPGSPAGENLGIPLVVVVTKTDLMDSLEKNQHFTDEHFDFIQMHLRRFCLRFGAALFYVSVKDDKNCNLLNEYLKSRIYAFPFTQSAYIVERNAIFIPAGWDSEAKIDILAENLATISPDAAYVDALPGGGGHHQTKLTGRVTPPIETKVPDDQAFLHRLATTLQQRTSNDPTGSSSPLMSAALDGHHQGSPSGRRSPRVSSAGSSRSSKTGPSSGGSPARTSSSTTTNRQSAGTGGGPGGSGASESMLASFFTNLLNKRSSTGSPSGQSQSPASQSGGDQMPPVRPVPPSVDKLNMSTTEIQAELERLARQPPPPATSPVNSDQQPERNDGSQAMTPTPTDDTPAREQAEEGGESQQQQSPPTQAVTADQPGENDSSSQLDQK